MTRRWRLFPKYALLIIALVAGMVLASGAVSIYFSHRENQGHLVALQDEKAQGAANRIEQYVQGIEHQLSWTALPRIDSSGGGDALEARRIEYLKLLRQVPAITEVVWIDPTGREQLRVSRLAMDTRDSGADLSKEPKFLQANTGKTFFGPVYFRKGTEPYLTIARPAGSGGGVTAAEVNLKFVWEVVSRIRIGEKGLAYVIDAGGTLIAHPDISLVLKKTDLRPLPQVAAVVASDGIAPEAARDLRGEPVFAAFARIPTLAWTVFVEAPRAEAYAPLYATLQRMGLVLVVALLISIAASYLLARALVRPLRALQEGAAQIGAGELDRHIEVRTGDELEGLAEQFNKMSADLKESYAGLERKVEERTAALSEALDRQTATGEILRVIAGSMSDVQPVFEAIAQSGVRLFKGAAVALSRPEGGEVRSVAIAEDDPERATRWRNVFPFPLERGYIHGAAMLDCRVVDVPDVLATDGQFDAGKRNLAPAGYRAITVVPMVRESIAIGAIAVARTVPGPLSEKQIALLKTFADQAVIAIENVRLFNETTEALETQTATADILKVISESPTDVQPVFDAIAERAKTLCDAIIGAVTRFDGEWVQFAAVRGASPQAIAALRDAFPMRPSDAAIMARAIRDHAPVQIHDVLLDPAYGLKEAAQQAAFRSAMAVPMLKEGQILGSIAVCRAEAGTFPDKQLKLLQTFADQAVIAIENVRLFNETKQALQRQTATAEILQVISSSVSDTQPVFDTILSSCERLFGGQHMGINLVGADGLVHLAAHSGPTPDRAAFERTFPVPLTRESGSGSAILEGSVMHYPDTQAANVPPYVQRSSRANMTRSVIIAPLLWQGRGIGAIFVGRGSVGPFSDEDIALLRTFADQAVIAIQNARLFNETKDALEQQTATSEVLKTISRTTFDLQPVLTTLIESASRLCKADRGFVYLREGEMYQMKVGYPVEPGGVGPQPLPADSGSLVGRTALTREIVHIEDARNDPGYTWKETQERLGYRTMLGVPMLREGEPIGVVAVWRDEVRPFSARDIRIVTTFADQAVIALENVRLLSEIQAKSRELEAANRHKSEFLANMSHELRTPLNAIIGFSEVLTEKMFGDINDKQLEYLHDIHSSGQHLLTLINDVLDLSKIEAGRMELDLSCFDLGLLLDNSLTLVRERAQRHGLNVTLDVSDGLEEWVADARKVKQVVVNLLSNAVKFTPTGGTVSLCARRVEAGDRVTAQISVADTGVGIAAEEQALVFEEFRQASGDYLRKTEGTGLGLSLAKRFVELHGGTIWLDSRPGAGATFTVTLPLQTLEAIA